MLPTLAVWTPGVWPLSDVIVRRRRAGCYAPAMVDERLALDRRRCDRARGPRRALRRPLLQRRADHAHLLRPTCPVKPAKSRNVLLYPTAAATERAGFRPCLRCRPKAAPGTPAEMAARAALLLDHIDGWLVGQRSLVNGRTRTLLLVVIQRRRMVCS